MKIFSKLVIIALVSFTLVGCSQRIATVSNMGDASHFNADQMSWFEKLTSITDKTLVFSSLVNVNNLNETSNFGRLYTDLMISQLEQEGWDIIDYRGKNIIVRENEGEFYLNRNELQSIPKDASVLVGTYGEYRDGLLLNLRILRMSDNKVLTTSSVHLLDKEVLAMSKNAKLGDAFAIKVVVDDCQSVKNCAGDK